jgi:hypothetical protein
MSGVQRHQQHKWVSRRKTPGRGHALRREGVRDVLVQRDVSSEEQTLLADDGPSTLCAEVVNQSQLYWLPNRPRDPGIELASVENVPQADDAG